jgi:hypothetical protein
MSEPSQSELLILAKRLCARRAAMVVPYKMLDATHVERLCHITADSWVRDNPGWKVILGLQSADTYSNSGTILGSR